MHPARDADARFNNQGQTVKAQQQQSAVKTATQRLNAVTNTINTVTMGTGFVGNLMNAGGAFAYGVRTFGRPRWN